MDAPEVRRSVTADALAHDVATALVTLLAETQAAGRVPCVALTGGTIAGRVHQAVAASSGASQVDWGRVDVWFGDERYVPAGDPERNARQARESLLDRLPFDPARLHPMPASDEGHPSLADAAATYAAELRAGKADVFDVVMLGVGPDGHVASLFPGFAQLDADDALVVPVIGSPKPPPERISLTLPALNRAREVWFLVSGEGKAQAVARALGPHTTPGVHELPAVGVHGLDRTVWFLDEDAASGL